MHILLIVNELSYFQAHRHDLMCDLVGQGHTVSVAAGGSQSDTVPKRPENWPDGVSFFPVKIDRHRLNPFLDLRFIHYIRKICRVAQPDVVHAITIKPVLFSALALASLGATRRPALVLTLPGLGKVFEPATAFGKRLRHRLVSATLRPAVAKTAAVLTTENPGDRNRLVEEGIASSDRAIAVAGAGLDRAVFNMHGRAHQSGPVRVLMASRLIETKGVKIYLETARRLTAAQVPMTFALAGPIDPTDADGVDEADLHEASASGSIAYLGSIAPTGMAETLRQFDVVVLPTLLREGFPRALLEAVACGCVPVASDQPAIRQLVRHNETGLLLKPVNADALEDALRRLVTDETLRRTLQRNATDHLARMAVGRDEVCNAFIGVYALALRCRGEQGRR